MLHKDSVDAIAEMIGVKVDELTTAISDEKEITLELPKGRFLNETDEQTLIDNHGKKKYDEGKVKGSKETIEILKTDNKLEFDGVKPEDFTKAFKVNILEVAKIEPDKKIGELTIDIEKLQKTIGLKDTAYETLESSVNKNKTKLKAQSYFPELNENLGITKEEASSLFFMSHEAKDDGVYKDGTKLKDTLQNDVTLEAAVKAFATDKGWDKDPSGRGGGAKGGKKGDGDTPKSMEEYDAYLEAKGINAGSMEANALLATIVKEEEAAS